MTLSLAAGTLVRVEVPASSANLGPGFDCFGLALDWCDTVELEVTAAGLTVEMGGEGAEILPRDAGHLVIAAAQQGLADLGVRVGGLALRATNRIPQGRGLGSSSAAIVAGLLAAQSLAGAGPDPAWLLAHASAIEGHPDNVAAAIYGGFVLAYGVGDDLAVASGTLHRSLGVVVLVPQEPVATHLARALLPATVPHRDAAANSGRAALLVHALAREPARLLPATEDWLHQPYRREAMPASADLVDRLRAEGLAAVISGAGPSVLVLGEDGDLDRVAEVAAPRFRFRRLAIGSGARLSHSR